MAASHLGAFRIAGVRLAAVHLAATHVAATHVGTEVDATHSFGSTAWSKDTTD